MAEEYDEQAPVRIPLSVATTPRNADLTKDALLQNCFIDGSQMGNKYVVKRPGFYVGSEAVTTGNNRGVYVNPNNVSGGTPGEVEVWYIPAAGGTYLSSFQVPDEPPEEPTLYVSFDVSGASGGEAIISFGNNPDPSVAFGFYFAELGLIIAFTPGGLNQGTDGANGFYEIYFDSNFYYVYCNGLVIATANYISITSEIADQLNSGKTISNVTFGP
jgi:hypothetical protein